MKPLPDACGGVSSWITIRNDASVGELTLTLVKKVNFCINTGQNIIFMLYYPYKRVQFFVYIDRCIISVLLDHIILSPM